MANKPENLKPFVKGDPRRINKPKGARSFKTIFEEAAREVANDLKLGKKPNAIQLEIIKRGIKEGLQGNYNFYRDTFDRLYGKAKENISLEAEGQIRFNEEIKIGEKNRKLLEEFIKLRKTKI